MTGLFGEICQLFCCPPRPSHIVAKLAFLPPPPTYSVISTANDSCCRIEFKPEAGWHMSDDATSGLSVFYTITRRRSRIVCMYIPASLPSSPYNSPGANTSHRRAMSPISLSAKSSHPMSASCPTLTDDVVVHNRQHPVFTGDGISKSPYTVLFSHGNAVDIGQMAGFLQSLAYRFGVNIMCYDYSGYGVSTGQRLEENLYADAEAALRELRDRYKVPLEKIVLYGQSIGTAPTVELATKHKVAGVVLHSPFMSGLRVVCPGTTRRFCFDPFTNIDKVSRILSPTLIIHGTDDEIIGIHHGRELFSRLPHPLEPAWIDGAGHNDIELFSEYAARLDRFFNEDLVRIDVGSGDQPLHSSPSSGFVQRLSPSPEHPTLRSAFRHRKSSIVHTFRSSRSSALRQNESMSTVNTTDTSKSEERCESAENLPVVPATEVDPEIRHHRTSSVKLVAGDQSGSAKTVSKRRVWTMRNDSAPTNLSYRSQTIHCVPGDARRYNSSPPKPTEIPEDAIPRPPPRPHELFGECQQTNGDRDSAHV